MIFVSDLVLLQNSFVIFSYNDRLFLVAQQLDQIDQIDFLPTVTSVMPQYLQMPFNGNTIIITIAKCHFTWLFRNLYTSMFCLRWCIPLKL